MVKNSASVSKRGLIDWVFQRVSAVILALYVIALVAYFFLHPGLNYHQWLHVAKNGWFQAATLVMLVALIIHAWVGLWTIFTDYVHNKLVRGILLCLVIVCSILYLVWTISILWG